MLKGIKFYTLSLAIAFISVLFIPQASLAQPYACLPTCSTTDSKFLVLAGIELASLNGTSIAFGIRSPGTSGSVELGVFDGDQGNLWDLPVPGADIEVSLFADPNNDGTGNVLVGQWLGATMPDNDWFVINQPNSPQAQTPDGDYIYKLVVRNLAPDVSSNNAFKLRTDGRIQVLPFEIFSFMPNIGVSEDLFIVYPNLEANLADPECVVGAAVVCDPADPDCCIHETTYDGDWCFSFNLPEGIERIEMFDGDFDFGSSIADSGGNCVIDGVDVDTDDPNTANDILFPWTVGTEVVFEGALLPSPPDDTCFHPFDRPPSVIYSLIGPQGTNIVNDNPSASQEWERFSVTTGPLDPAVDDLSVAMLEPGLWLIKVFGLDQVNLNVIRFPFAINGEDENGEPVPFDPPEDIRPIPTLSEWGLIAFALFTLFISVYYIRRNRKLGADIK